MRCAPPLDSTPVETPDAQPRQRPDYPIVGIGCSAGGLEALGVLLSGAPPDSGMAFIVVQHLDPEHPSNLPELLQRDTPMPVVEASDGMLVRPDCVYVIPPNKDLSLLHGALHLLDPTEKRGLRLPIDFFLRTLAADRQERAIGVILSGMGSDGMAGLAAIKEKGGLTLAQDPASARADSMPASAIKAGVVDIVAPADAQRYGLIDAQMGRDEALRHFAEKAGVDPNNTRLVQSAGSSLLNQLFGADARPLGVSPAVKPTGGQPARASAAICATSVKPVALHGDLSAFCG